MLILFKLFYFTIDAKTYANSVSAFFIETSAKDSHNITKLFINGKFSFSSILLIIRINLFSHKYVQE